MKKFILFFVTLWGALYSYAQPQLQLLTFEQISFDNTREDFCAQLRSNLGWKILEATENGVIFMVNFCGTDGLAVVEFTPKTQLPVLIKIFIQDTPEKIMGVYTSSLIKFTKAYGEAIGVEGRQGLKIWQPKFKGYEMIDAHCGLVMLEKAEREISINILDSTHKLILDKEREMMNNEQKQALTPAPTKTSPPANSGKHIIFEGVSFANSRKTFLLDLKEALGWETVKTDTYGDTLSGEYNDCLCRIITSYTPIKKLPATIHIIMSVHNSLIASNFTQIEERLTRQYGKPLAVEDMARKWSTKEGEVIFRIEGNVINIMITDNSNYSNIDSEWDYIKNNG